MSQPAGDWLPNPNGSTGRTTANGNATDNTDGPKIRTFEDIPSIFSFANRKIEYVLEGIIPAGAITAFTGEPGSGKSTLTWTMAYKISRGEPFAGRATQRRPVLALDGHENPHAVVIERFERFGMQDSANFKLWGGWCPEDPPDASSVLIQTWVASMTPKPVICIDALAGFLDGDENDATIMRGHMQRYRKLADMGATIVLLHHPGKSDNAKEYRGSSDFKASLDVAYTVMNIGNPMHLELVRLKAWKARVTVDQELILRVRDGEFVADEITKPADTNAAIMQDLLIAHPEVKAGEFERLASSKGVPHNRARRWLDEGIRAGTIDVESGANNAKLYTWLGEPRQDNEQGIMDV